MRNNSMQSPLRKQRKKSHNSETFSLFFIFNYFLHSYNSIQFLHLISYFMRKFSPSCNLRKTTSSVRESWILPIGKSRTPSIYDKSGLHFMKNYVDNVGNASLWCPYLQKYFTLAWQNIPITTTLWKLRQRTEDLHSACVAPIQRYSFKYERETCKLA